MEPALSGRPRNPDASAKLSNGVCSLNKNEDRLAFTVMIDPMIKARLPGMIYLKALSMLLKESTLM